MNTATPTTLVEAVRSLTNKELVALVLDLQDRVTKLESSSTKTPTTGKEMTDEDAEKVIYGELSAVKHKDAADKLGLTYGQVYSARLEFTFKNVHKKASDAGKKNPWKK